MDGGTEDKTASIRALAKEDAKALNPGDTHYTSYVGYPKWYDVIGGLQFRLLLSLGLREHHKLLDFGCGSLRAGRLFIPYLEPGKYFGVDPNEWLIQDAISNEMKPLKNPLMLAPIIR